MTENARSRPTPGTSVDVALRTFAAKFEQATTRRQGTLLFRMTGDNGGDFYVHSTSTGCWISREASAEPPRVEVIGGARRIIAILSGSKEGRRQFSAGGMRVRGDLQYLSDIAYELGLITAPFWLEST